MRFYEHLSRSLVKTVTYRVAIIITNTIVVFWLTHRLDLTLAIVTVSNILNTVIYFFHERIWNSVHWGKRSA